MAKQIYVESQSGNITVTTSRAVIGTLANVENANTANFALQADTANVANTALNVDLANVNGAGNIASINLDGNTANVLYGNGVFAEAGVPQLIGDGGNLSNINGANVTGFVANANVANTAQSVAGANVTGEVANAQFATNAENANVANTANSVAGANVTGEVANAAFATLAGTATVANSANAVDGANVTGEVSVANTVSNPNQSNITQVGNLSSLTVSANATVAGNLTVGGNIQYSNITQLYVTDPIIELGGAPNNQPLTANDGKDRGTLLHYYTTEPIDAFMGWDNSNGEFAFGSNVTNANDVVTINNLGNVRADTFIGDLQGEASSANVADSANSVAGANVTGEVANANVANTADTANTALSVDGANVSGAVANATFATDAESANTANTALSVDVANVSNIGNIATIDLDGDASNILFGNGVFSEVPTPNRIEDAVTIGNNTVTGNIEFNFQNSFVSLDQNLNGDTLASIIVPSDPSVFDFTPVTSYNSRFSIATPGPMGNAGSGVTQFQRPVIDSQQNFINPGTNSLTATRFTAYRGNNFQDRQPVQQGDGLGSFEWRYGTVIDIGGGPETGNSIFPFPLIDAVVDQYSGAAFEEPQVGFKFQVIDANNTPIEHRMYSNGDVELNGLTIGNVAGAVFDGSSSNVLYGNGVFAPAGNGGGGGTGDSISNGNSVIEFTGVDGNAVVTIDGQDILTVSQNEVNSTANIISESDLGIFKQGSPTIYDQKDPLADPNNCFVPAAGNDNAYFIVPNTSPGFFTQGEQISFEDVVGPGNANLNGGTFFVDSANVVFNNHYPFFLDSGLTQPGTFSGLGIVDGQTGGGNVLYDATPGTQGYDWRLTPDIDDLVFEQEGNAKVTFTNNGDVIADNFIGNVETSVIANGQSKIEIPQEDGTIDITKNGVEGIKLGENVRFGPDGGGIVSPNAAFNNGTRLTFDDNNIFGFADQNFIFGLNAQGLQTFNTLNQTFDDDTTYFATLNTAIYSEDQFIAPRQTFRSRGGSPFSGNPGDSPVFDGDQVFGEEFRVYADSTNDNFNILSNQLFVDTNDQTGNLTASWSMQMNDALVDSNLSIQSNNIDLGQPFGNTYLLANDNGVQINNGLTVNSNGLDVTGDITVTSGFVTHTSLPASVLTTITGVVGQVAAVSDNNGKLAYWDTGNNRWSYVSDDSAV